MLLRFNSQATLTSALATGAIPHDAAMQPIWWAKAADNAVIVESSYAFPQANLEQLAMLRVKGSKGTRSKNYVWQQAKSWLQAVPLVRDREQEFTSQTPVIFESSTLDGAAEMALEMLRLGNDRQGLLSLETESIDGALGPRYFLRALGPSFYTVLRATEVGSSVRGFVERRPRIYVEAGWNHPLIDRLSAPPGQQWLLAAENSWRQLPEIPFRDLYEVAEFVLPGKVLQAQPRPAETFSVPVALAAGSNDQPAEMWVLKRDALGQVQQFVETAAEEVVARLSFAVIEAGREATWVVLRIRPGQGLPPALVFEGTALAPVQRLNGILVPVGKRLFPPIRRDAIQKLLSPGEGNTLWLEVDESGAMQRRIVADAAFRPLREWVAYTIDAAAAPLKEWFESATFDFSEFVCREDQQRDPNPQAATATTASSAKPTLKVETPAKSNGPRDVMDEMVQAFPAKPTKAPKPDELVAIREEARKLEVAFVSDRSPLDAPHRLSQWPQMAELQRVLSRHREAILCYLHRSWEDQRTAAHDMLAWSTLVREASGKGGKTGLIDDRGQTTAHQLDETLALAKPSPLQVEQLAAWLAWQAANRQSQTIVTERIGKVMAFLEKWDRLISVRGAWLAQLALSSVSGGDALLVARARDRILERIFSQGIDPDVESPAFLWDVHTGERLGELRARTFELCETVQDWSVKNLGVSSRATAAYIDFAFAFVLARLGEIEHSQKLTNRANRMIESQQHDREGRVHQWLSEAFRARIRQAVDRRETTGPLPDKLLAELTGMDQNSRYKIDRMRERSRILQPLERLYPYRHFWLPVASTPIIKQVDALADCTGQAELLKAAETLLHRKDVGDTGCRIIAKLLELGPRLGERFLLQVLPSVGPLLSSGALLALRIAVAEKAIVAAGHFGHVEFARDTASTLNRLLTELRTTAVDVKTLDALATMIGAWSRNLRRMGLHRDLAAILPKLAALASPAGGMPTSLEGLRLILAVAAAELSMSRGNSQDNIDPKTQERAREVVANVRAILHHRPFDARGTGHIGSMMQSQLASAYVTAVGTLPLNEMWALYGDLFSFLSGVEDNSSMATAVSMKQYDIVDAMATTLLSDDFQRDDAARRWIEEEEFLIRRRIHNDLRAAEAKAAVTS